MMVQGNFTKYFLDSLTKTLEILDVDALGIKALISHPGMGCRGMWDNDAKIVKMNPRSKCFQPDYRGWKYKKWGGVADLTPGGVFVHEAGHAFSFKHTQIFRLFRQIRKTKKNSITSYGTSSIGEDVAECFRLYVTNPKLLCKLKPNRYAAIHSYGQRYITVRYNVQFIKE